MQNGCNSLFVSCKVTAVFCSSLDLLQIRCSVECQPFHVTLLLLLDTYYHGFDWSNLSTYVISMNISFKYCPCMFTFFFDFTIYWVLNNHFHL